MHSHQTIYLCRHGETPWTISKQHTGRTDLSLTEEGKKQAQLLGKRLQQIPLDRVYSSPLKRAKESCELAGFKPLLEPDAMECDYGKYDGLTYKEITKIDPSWNLFETGAPGGESIHQISERADHLIQKFLHDPSQNIALFSHGHFLRVLAVRWLGLSPEKAIHFSLSVASLSQLSTERSSRVIKLWNDTSHLG